MQSKKSNPATQGRSARRFTYLIVRVNDNGRPIGEDARNAKYLDDDVETVCRLRAEGCTWTKISRMMDIPVRTARDFVSGRRRAESVAGFRKIRRKIYAGKKDDR